MKSLLGVSVLQEETGSLPFYRLAVGIWRLTEEQHNSLVDLSQDARSLMVAYPAGSILP